MFFDDFDEGEDLGSLGLGISCSFVFKVARVERLWSCSQDQAGLLNIPFLNNPSTAVPFAKLSQSYTRTAKK